MKKIIISIVSFLFVIISFGQSQVEMNQESYKEYQKSEAEINAVYQSILVEYKTDTAFTRNLKIAQRLWIKFRDAEVKAMFPNREAGYYGSVHSMCVSTYMKELTDERIKKLKIWLVGLDEGEICNGSVKTKN
jgi:uncharacterized protein YecT (DUF1311 family)